MAIISYLPSTTSNSGPAKTGPAGPLATAMNGIDDTLDAMGDACYFSTLDLASGYWLLLFNIRLGKWLLASVTYCKRSVHYLGHVLSGKGVETDPEKIRCVAHWPTPTCPKELKQFLG